MRASGRVRRRPRRWSSRAGRTAGGPGQRCPGGGPAGFRTPSSGWLVTDSVGLLLGQAQSRVQELVPMRYGRMLVSAFTFYRAALLMASDLATTPNSGLNVQLCGDAHLSNFGAFASPERPLMFDVNDFDETLPGPWEWDVKRLAASVRSSLPGTKSSPPRPAAAPRQSRTEPATDRRWPDSRECPRLMCGTPTSMLRSCSPTFAPPLAPPGRRRTSAWRPDPRCCGQGPYQDSTAGAGQADHRGRRSPPDRQRPSTDRARRRALL